MKKISILREKLTNFMGVASYETDFSEKSEFRGENGTGKTTLATAFFWTLWGKDIAGRSDTKFCVKPLDEYNETYPNLVTEVEIVLSVDDRVIKLRRTYKEIWGTRRGETEPKYQGNETCRYWDDVLKKEREYISLVNTEICEEGLFRLVTDPAYFFSLDQQKERKILTDITGNVTPEMLLKNHPEFLPIVSEISATKTITDYQKQVSETIKRLKADAETIPTRIDERKRDMPEAENWSEIESEIESTKKDIADIEAQILDRSKAITALSEKKVQLSRQIANLHDKIVGDQEVQRIANMKSYNADMKAYNDSQFDIMNLKKKVTEYRSAIDTDSMTFRTLQERRNDLLTEYYAIKSRTFEFDESKCICPTCKRPLETSDIEQKRIEMQNAFNAKNASDLEANVAEGQQIKAKMQTLTDRINIYKQSLEDTNKELEEKQKVKLPEIPSVEIVDTPEIISFRQQIDALEKERDSINTNTDDFASELLKRDKEDKQNTLQMLSKRLSVREIITNNQNRINELTSQFSAIQTELARQTGILDLIKRYQKTYMCIVESSVNQMFSLIEFKLYEKQINEGEREICEALVDGVPYSTNVNTASRINAGLDFVYGVQRKHDISAPVWIDNGESVTNILYTDNIQTITLVKDSNYKSLTKTK